MPCEEMKPVMAEIKEEYGNILNYEYIEVEVNKDDHKVKKFKEAFDEGMHPATYIISPEGDLVRGFIGLTPKMMLIEALDALDLEV
ncbi:MAG: hypothetical protein APF76_14420 [Desulfitibacter sp. BRH_c19]|nr:MAG: hypothetical protein APF76_14420 [Desulfitibacter sp. BRH_c19]